MDKKQNANPSRETKDMLKEKTNQDFNNQKPNPEDPNQNKSHQTVEENEEQNNPS